MIPRCEQCRSWWKREDGDGQCSLLTARKVVEFSMHDDLRPATSLAVFTAPGDACPEFLQAD